MLRNFNFSDQKSSKEVKPHDTNKKKERPHNINSPIKLKTKYPICDPVKSVKIQHYQS